MTKILAVDDDVQILKLIRNALAKEGYEVTVQSDPLELKKMKLTDYQLILLDVMMPKVDGFTLCEEIRGKVDCPILFLTAKTKEADIMRGLGIGGDDYITKPFSLNELAARVAAHLRRDERGRNRSSVLASGGLIVNLSERIVSWHGREIPFSKREFDLIEFLMTNGGQVFDKERIYERVWGYDAEGDSGVIKEHIRKIRAKLRDVTGRDYIETVWGVGYKFEVNQ